MTTAFYDALAPYYHLIYPDWDASSRRQATALVTLLGELGVPPGNRVLDAACGIGTQALGRPSRDMMSPRRTFHLAQSIDCGTRLTVRLPGRPP